MGFQHAELVVEGHDNWLPSTPPQGQHCERWYHGDGLGEEEHALYREKRVPVTDAVQTWNSARPVAWHNSTWIGDQTIRFLDWAGSAPEGRFHGQSLRPLIETDTAHRDFAVCEWDLGPARIGVPLRRGTVRTKQHKLTVELESGAGELYDLGIDPDEMENRFDDPAYAALRAELLAMIASRPDDALDAPLPRAGMA